ncbi:Hypothetical_protein [Hexamita inflata]|uniref:Hypothetical_protein n=1 Tax=Hexamita inflata TaxID=28002 RepID=A0AA86TI92_9EUKA|nr:Hypothetical protein HINF_LOCUS4337 [Hexamita inflata]
MQLHFLILNSVITRSSFQPCSHSVYKGFSQILYCQKQSTLNNLQVTQQFVIQTSQVSNVFVGVGQVQNSQISIHVEVPRFSSFSLFGQINSVTILESTLNVSLLDETSQAASVCIQCDVQISYSNVTFVSSGQNASGLVVQPVSSITIQNCFFQLRLDADLASGIVLVVNQVMDSFSITNFNLTSHFVDPSSNSGLIVSTPVVQVTVSVTSFQYCSQYDSLVGQSYYSSFVKTAYPVYNCDSICNELYFVYGLCLNGLQFSQTNGKTLTCGENFEFVGDSCVCYEGYVLNLSQCVNAVSYLTSIQSQVANQIILINKLQQTVSQNQVDIQSQVQSNVSILEQRILNNISAVNTNILNNVSVLQNYILTNKTQLTQQISDSQKYLEGNIKSNFTTMDARLLSNTTNIIYFVQTQINETNNKLVLLQGNLQMVNSTSIYNYTKTQSNFSDINTQISTLTDTVHSLQTDNIQLKTQIEALQNRLDKIQFKSDRGVQYICLTDDNCKSYVNNPLGS